ncbi:hypothetical protein BDR04DRAFT_1085812 [Suillus decipiens]|nr:hypothetical protein BDR04DRAFT_1085812 [Suillus decipiens]
MMLWLCLELSVGAGSLFLVFWLACLMLNEELRGFNADGALVTAHSHTSEFLSHGPTQQSHVSSSHAIFPGEQLNQAFLIAPSDRACFHITHVLCSTHFLSRRKLKWKPYIVMVSGRERGEQRLEASGSEADP